jgi:hypothetical protein
MTGSNLGALVGVVLVVVTIWATLMFLIPAAARARFEYHVNVIRDDCMDLALAGTLDRREPCVAEFLAEADSMVADSSDIRLSRALAVHLALDEVGWPTETDGHSYNQLQPDQRRVMHELDRRLFDELGQYLVWGSRFGPILWLVHRAVRHVPRARRRPRVVANASPSKLAREYSAHQDAMAEAASPRQGWHPIAS